MTTETQIDISGPFSWAASLDVLERWEPVRRHRRERDEVTRIAFPLDGDFTPVAAALRWADGALRVGVDGRLDAERVRALGPEAGPASVLGIRGIGPFWAQGIYLRGCGIVDAFPDEPLAIAALGHLHGHGDQPAPDVLRRLTERLRPYRMWADFLP